MVKMSKPSEFLFEAAKEDCFIRTKISFAYSKMHTQELLT